MIEWVSTVSGRIQAVAYDAVSETIYVRFNDGAEWWYGGCPPHIWEEFTAPGTSKGRYVHDVLDGHAKGPLVP